MSVVEIFHFIFFHILDRSVELTATTRALLKMHQVYRQFGRKAKKCSRHPHCYFDVYICHFYEHEGHAITCRPASPSSVDKHATIVLWYAKKNDKRPFSFPIFISLLILIVLCTRAAEYLNSSVHEI